MYRVFKRFLILWTGVVLLFCGLCAHAAGAGHTHSFTYSVHWDEGVIVAECSDADGLCNLPDRKATLTIIPPSDLTYDGTSKEVTISCTIPGTTCSDVVYSRITDHGYEQMGYGELPIEAGKYSAEIELTDNASGTVKEAYLDYTILQREVTVTPKNQSVNLNESIQTGATWVTSEGLLEGHEIFSVVLISTDTSAVTDDGEITISENSVVIKDEYYLHDYTANYIVNPQVGKLVVKKKAPYVTAPIKPTDLVYNGTEQSLLSQAGITDGGTMQYVLGENDEAPDNSAAWSTDFPKGKNAGTYYVWYRVKGDEEYHDVDPNYCTVEIAPKSLSGATVTLDRTETVYTGTEQSVTVTEVLLDSVALASDDYIITGNTGTNAGTYTVTVTGAGNYTGTAGADWTITPKAMTVAADDITVPYDGLPHGITVTVADPSAGAIVRYGSTAGTYDLTTSPTVTNVSDGRKTVYYQVTAANYQPAEGSAAVTVTKAAQQAPTAPEAETVSGNSIILKESDGYEYSMDGITWQRDPVFAELTPQTDYSFYQRIAEDTNHIASPASEKATIHTSNHIHKWSYTASGAEITATCADEDGGHDGEKTAVLTLYAPKRKVYGGSESADATVSGRIDGVSLPEPVYAKDGTNLSGAPTAAGTYTASITLGNATAGVTYTIARAVPEYTLPTGLTAVYGQTLADAVLPTGWAWEDASSGVGNAGETVFPAIYTPDDSANYESVREMLSLTVTPKALTIRAEKKMKVYGESDPALTYTAEGLIGTDTVTGSLSRDPGNSAGTYAIRQGTLTAGENYRITFIGADFIIKKGRASVTPPTGKTFVYTGEMRELVSAGTADGGTMNYVLGSDETAAPATGWGAEIPAAVDAGTYYIWYKAVGDTEHLDSVAACVTAVIRKAVPGVTAPVPITGLAYTGSAQQLITAGNAVGGTMQYSLEEDGEYTEILPSAVNAGTYSVWYRVTGDTNYEDLAPQSVTVMIRQVYTVTFASNGGTGSLEAITCAEGEYCVLPDCGFTAPEGQVFRGWQVGTDSAVKNAGERLTVTADITVTALWADIAVTGVTLDRTSAALTVGETLTLTVTVTPANAANRTVLWASDNAETATVENGTVIAVAAGTAVITATTADGAKTAACVITVQEAVCTISFDGNGGSGVMAPETRVKGSVYTLPVCGFTAPANKRFLAWQIGEDTALAEAGASITITADVYLKAVWTDITVTGVSLDRTSAVLNIGETLTLTATVTPANAANRAVLWSTDNAETATVENGTVTAVAAGTAAITVTTVDGAKTAACMITVRTTTYAISFDGNGGSGVMASETRAEGDIYVLPACAFLAPANKVFRGWQVGDETDPLPAGTRVTITGNLLLKAVWTDITVTGVSLDRTAVTLITGETLTLTATVTPDNAANREISWSTDNAEIAEVSNGTVTAVSAGTATITVTTTDGGKTATCVVTVENPPVPTHLLTVRYLYTDGTKAAASYTATLEEGAEYSVPSPEIKGYTADQMTVTGTMGSEDITVTVTYAMNIVDEVIVNGGVYSLNHEKNTATFRKAQKENAAKLKVNSTVKANGKKYKVTAVAEGACKGMKKLASLVIGAQVKALGKNAFADCPALKTVKGGARLTSIGVNAFANCPNLTSVATLKKLTKISDGAFRNTGLKKFTLGAKLTTIGKNAFANCTKLTKIEGGKALTTIEANAFTGDTKLTTVPVLAKLTTIGDSVFNGCKALTKITLSAKVTTVGKNAFSGCVKLKTVAGGKAVTKIGAGAFSGCTGLTTLPDFGKLTTIGDSAFKGCKAITKITLSEKVKSIGKNAFNGCAKLKTIVIKTKLLKDKNVGAGAFKGISSKATVTCPKGMAKTYRKLLLKKGMPKGTVFK